MAISDTTKLRCDQLNTLGLKFAFDKNAYIGDIGSKHFYVPALDISTYDDKSWDILLKDITQASIDADKRKQFSDSNVENKKGQLGIGNKEKSMDDVTDLAGVFEVQERRIPLNIKGQRRNKYMKLRFGTIIKECPKCGREMVYSCTCDWDPKESDYDWSEFVTERHFILMNSKKRFQKDDSIKSKVVEFPFWNESDFSREIVSIDAELFFNAYEIMKGYPRALVTIDPDKESLRILLNDAETRVQQELSNTYFKISKNTIIHE